MKRQEFEFKAAQVRKDMLEALITAMSEQVVKTVNKKKTGTDGFLLLLKFISDKKNQSFLINLPLQMTKTIDVLMYRLVTFIEKELKIDWKD